MFCILHYTNKILLLSKENQLLRGLSKQLHIAKSLTLYPLLQHVENRWWVPESSNCVCFCCHWSRCLLEACCGSFHLLRHQMWALQGRRALTGQPLCLASHNPPPCYENLRFFMASALTARLLAQMVRTTMRTPTTNVTTGQRKQCRRTISSCVRCRRTSSGLWCWLK